VIILQAVIRRSMTCLLVLRSLPDGAVGKTSAAVSASSPFSVLDLQSSSTASDSEMSVITSGSRGFGRTTPATANGHSAQPHKSTTGARTSRFQPEAETPRSTYLHSQDHEDVAGMSERERSACSLPCTSILRMKSSTHATERLS